MACHTPLAPHRDSVAQSRYPFHETSICGTHFQPQHGSCHPDRGSQEVPCPITSHRPGTLGPPITAPPSIPQEPLGASMGFLTRGWICRIFTAIQVIRLLHRSLALHFACMHFYHVLFPSELVEIMGTKCSGLPDWELWECAVYWSCRRCSHAQTSPNFKERRLNDTD